MNARSCLAAKCGALAIATLIVFVVVSPATASPHDQGVAQLPPFNFSIRTLSNRADLISDGDALVEVRVPQVVPMDKVTLSLNGADVTAAFVADSNRRTLRGVVTGLVVGENDFVADSTGNGAGRPWAH